MGNCQPTNLNTDSRSCIRVLIYRFWSPSPDLEQIDDPFGFDPVRVDNDEGAFPWHGSTNLLALSGLCRVCPPDNSTRARPRLICSLFLPRGPLRGKSARLNTRISGVWFAPKIFLHMQISLTGGSNVTNDSPLKLPFSDFCWTEKLVERFELGFLPIIDDSPHPYKDHGKTFPRPVQSPFSIRNCGKYQDCKPPRGSLLLYKATTTFRCPTVSAPRGPIWWSTCPICWFTTDMPICWFTSDMS